MAQDRFFIAPYDSGLITSIKPWAIPEDAFERLRNAYIFRGVVRKRPGSKYTGYGWATNAEEPLYSRLRINLGNTHAATGVIAGTVPGAIFSVGQIFSIGDRVFTVYQEGTPANMHSTWILGQLETATFNTTTGAYNISGGYLNTPCYWYPSEPVMGFKNFEAGALNTHTTFAFDTQFAYRFWTGFWQRSGTSAWNGTNSQFFSATNWRGVTENTNAMFVTNFNATIGVPGVNDDPMYSTDGTTWAAYNPRIALASGGNPDRYVKTAKVILQFKGRLLLFNTIEDSEDGTENEAFVMRVRYSRDGNPFSADQAWLPGVTEATGGNYLDIPTSEEIISVATIRDRIIVYCERSTWELVFIYNFTSPFVFQSINSEIGATSQFSAVGFDRYILTAGYEGMHKCSGSSVKKKDFAIDGKTEEFRIENDGLTRIHGIRDQITKLVYWTYPTFDAGPTRDIFPNNLLVYNYENETWSVFDDSITTFGTFEGQTENLIWQDAGFIWQFLGRIWGRGTEQANYKSVIAGNQQGFVFIIDKDRTNNEKLMQITHIVTPVLPPWNPLMVVTIMNHNLVVGDYIRVSGVVGIFMAGTGIYRIFAITRNTITFFTGGASLGIYLGGGYVSRVSRIDILSKQWNFYNDKASNVFVSKIDFCVDRTENGEITVGFLSSSSTVNLQEDAVINNCALGNNILETSPYAIMPLEATQDRFWHPIYFQAEGENVQIRMRYSDDQMADPLVDASAFELEAIVVHAQKTGSRFE